MDRQLFSSALREVRADLSKRNTVIALLGVGIVLGLSGPFETIALMKLLPRLLYWIVVASTTFALGSLISAVCARVFVGKPFWLRMICSALLIGTCVTVFLTALNMLVFNVNAADVTDVMPQWGLIVLISAVVDIGVNLAAPNSPDPLPPILDRISLAKRGDLIALSAEDHYVKVTTVNGTDMILMRLSDAIKEVGSTAGLQIHRSHWVALNQIQNATRASDRGTVTLSNDETRPISRSYIAVAKTAGLFPKGRADG